MSRMRKTAEKAALVRDGGEEFDTQKCNELQDEFFLSSPARGEVLESEQRDRQQLQQSHLPDNDVHLLSNRFKPQSLSRLATTTTPLKPSSRPEPEPEHGPEPEPERESSPEQVVLPAAKKEVARRDPIADNEIFSKPPAQPTFIIRRNAQGQLRMFNSQGRELPMTQDLRRAMEVGNDFTQRSSMSLTQENSASAYEHISVNRFATLRQSSVPDEAYFAKPATEADVPTDSTPYTYHENDPGHIKLDLDIEDTNQTSGSQNALSQDGASQDGDASESDIYRVALKTLSSQPQVTEPQTPATTINPFDNRGSVMNGAELFGATQPSAVGPRFRGTPPSSRPSPVAYNNFETPAPYRTISSPLVHTNDTPMQSLRQIPQSTGSKSKSFGPSAIKPRSLFEPRRYNSMQVSQEKRQRSSSADLSSDDSDIEAEPRQRRKQKQKVIKKQLSAVEFRVPFSSGAVEVPSTSSNRRPSAAELYIRQCDGSDTQDTEKDDVIADSQALPVDNGESSPSRSPNTQLWKEGEKVIAGDDTASLTRCFPESDHKFTPDCPSTIAQSSAAQPLVPRHLPSPTKNLSQSQPSLPLQEVSSNLKLLTTPSQAKGRDDDAVPETSPVTQTHIRPMGDIGLSFGSDEDDEDDLRNIPGFSQDVGFEAIMKLRSTSQNRSPPKPSRESKKKTYKIPEKAASLVPASSDVERFSTAPEPGVEKINSTPEQEPHKEVKKLSSVVKAINLDAINPIHLTPLPPGQSTTTSEPKKYPAEKLAPKSASKPAQPLAEESQSLFVTQLELDFGVVKDVDATVGEENPSMPQRDEAQPDFANDTYKEEAIRRPPRTAPVTPPAVENNEPQTSAIVLANPPLGSSTPADQEPSVMQSTASSLSSAPISTLENPQPEPAAPKKGRKIARGGPVKAKVVKKPANKGTPKNTTPVPKQNKRKAAILKDNEEFNRPSKRQSLRASREDSIDPLLLPGSAKDTRFGSRLFSGMALTLSYMKRDNRKRDEKDHEIERDLMTKIIKENGGQVLEDGFESLFESGPRSGQVAIPNTAVATSKRSLGFVAVIANIHSSKPKYIQALALGLPCLSPHWILSCVTKDSIVDWKPYLLCAGESPLLGLNFMSRHLTSYPSAAESKLVSAVAERPKILEGMSIIAVGARGVIDEKLKAFAFLGWVAAPERFCLLASFEDARKQLLKDEAEGVTWDLVFCDEDRRVVETAIFSISPPKRKRASTASKAESPPKKVRVINKDDLLQSFILGQLVEDQSTT